MDPREVVRQHRMADGGRGRRRSWDGETVEKVLALWAKAAEGQKDASIMAVCKSIVVEAQQIRPGVTAAGLDSFVRREAFGRVSHHKKNQAPKQDGSNGTLTAEEVTRIRRFLSACKEV